MNNTIRCLLALAAGLTTAAVQAEDLLVAVASNFTTAMKEIATAFEKDSGYHATLSYGSSGKFYAQITHGAPFEVFLSADQAKAAALENNGLAVPRSRFTYAIGALALWSPDQHVDADTLAQGGFNKLALANPKLAPYGAAAVGTLESLQLRQATEPKWVQGENIAQAYQFVSTGNAELGFVALSQIMAGGRLTRGTAWIVPQQLYPPILQDLVLLQKGAHNPAALALVQFMRSDKARGIIASYGYRTANNSQ